jgi:tRNA A-37 threonylcarbamoyl transferase component Bud32
MGEVWAATHAITRRRVAMKFLKGSASMRPEMRQRFLREARAASLVQHPSVIEVLDVFELDGGVPVMVMDLLTGETLGAKLARDRVLPAGEVASLLLPVVEAVEAAHAMGIVHRDLKPDNIFLKSAEGGKVSVKVLDFGIAKLTAKEGDAAETGALTGTGSVVGTPWYMAPEQCTGERDVDLRADVWALGVILYECLSGQRPVEGSNVGQLVQRMMRDGIVPIEERVPGLAPDLARLVGKMLSREREDRPQSLAQVREVLSGRAGGGPMPATSGGAPVGEEPGSDAATPPRWDTGGPHSVPGPQASRPFAARRVLAAVMVAAVAGVIGWSVTHSAGRRASDEALVSGAGTQWNDLAAVGLAPPPSAVATAAQAIAGTAVQDRESPPVAPAPDPAVGRLPSLAPSRTGPVPSSRSGERAALWLTRSTDAGASLVKNTAAAASATEASMAPARPKGDGGLFQELPF